MKIAVAVRCKSQTAGIYPRRGMHTNTNGVLTGNEGCSEHSLEYIESNERVINQQYACEVHNMKFYSCYTPSTGG